MAARDWSKLYHQHRGQWVALADDRMTAVAHGDSRREVKQAALKLGHSHPLVVKFPDELIAFAG